MCTGMQATVPIGIRENFLGLVLAFHLAEGVSVVSPAALCSPG